VADATTLFDVIHEHNLTLLKCGLPTLNKLSEFFKKGSQLESEEIDDELKAKFLYRLIREYRL
jgi:hypothetical protein